ncbi:MAG TPA: murein L,D-transpeptidase catalytic domain family protein [Flavobacterium sp.]|nr:murein L,D-transpeptidase catalytic domain family protein [Flavobacterium sp.]
MVYRKSVFFLMLASLFVSPNVFFSKEKASSVVLKSNEVRVNVEPSIEEIYGNLHSEKYSLPNLESFKEALKGFNKLKAKGVVKKNIITLIDFSLSANSKRLWVIDLDSNTILYHSLVAHGRNTGNEYANSFSNAAESYKSSLGFYVTGEIYTGKHGRSLRLDGLEKGINDNARSRAVVMHGANYVSSSFIQNNKRLGRSLGCPAIPVEITDEVIDTIRDKSCLFIYYPSKTYMLSSDLLS